MASNKNTVLKRAYSKAWKIPYAKVFERLIMVGMSRKLLPIACPKENQQKVLAKKVQLVRKRGGPQD